MNVPEPSPSRDTLGRWVLGLLLLVVFVWVAFFDSHSLVQRYRWHQNLDELTTENATLRQEIQQLQRTLDRPLADSTVERIAREEYGMKRPGEVIFPVEDP